MRCTHYYHMNKYVLVDALRCFLNALVFVIHQIVLLLNVQYESLSDC